jgi:hypothetical protein
MPSTCVRQRCTEDRSMPLCRERPATGDASHADAPEGEVLASTEGDGEG